MNERRLETGSDKDPRLDRAVEAVASYERAKEIPQTLPYIYERRLFGAKVEIFGTRHSTDPEDRMFDEIRERVGALDAKYRPMVLVEGHPTPPKSDQEPTSHGEMAYVARLCQERGIEWASWDRPDAMMGALLREKGFSKEQIAVWTFFLENDWKLNVGGQALEDMDFARGAYHAQDIAGLRFQGIPSRAEMQKLYSEDKEDFAREAKRVAEKFRSFLDRVTEKELGAPITLTGEALGELTDPFDAKQRKTVFNMIARAFNEERDRHLVRVIAQHAKEGRPVHIFAGATHAVMIEPALEVLSKASTAA